MIRLDKYILKFEQIIFVFWTNTFCNLEKYNVASLYGEGTSDGKSGSRHGFKYDPMDKYILKFEQILFVFWTNTFCNLEKYNTAASLEMGPETGNLAADTEIWLQI